MSLNKVFIYKTLDVTRSKYSGAIVAKNKIKIIVGVQSSMLLLLFFLLIKVQYFP